MELQGDWDPGAGAGTASDKNLFSKLGWFPFPSVPGGAGDPKAVLGGGDGYSCTTGASEPACAEFLQFLTTPAVQKQIIGAGVGLPANPAANGDLTVAAEQDAAAANSAAPYIAEYFDIALPHHSRPEPGQRGGEVVHDPEPTGSAIISSVSAP